MKNGGQEERKEGKKRRKGGKGKGKKEREKKDLGRKSINRDDESTVGGDVGVPKIVFVVYYELMKRNLKIKPTYECRCNGRLQTKRFTRLSHTGLVVELEHLKIKTRLTNEMFPCVKGECEI
jgi:hypothetical protein